MQDQEFLQQFENCTLPPEEMRHRGHIRLAWLYLLSLPLDQAVLKVTHGILRYATSLGAVHIYNETLTRLWVYLVYQAMDGSVSSFEQFIEKNAFLLDKNLPSHYYTPALLESESARKAWVEPDLKPLDMFKV